MDVTILFLQPSKEWEGRLPVDTYDTVFNTNISGINIAATDLARIYSLDKFYNPATIKCEQLKHR